jgi:RES domain-containing protein
VKVWRLCKRRQAAFDGEGARRASGRWNHRGTAVVYTSETLSLAALELFVHCDPALLPDDLVAIESEIPDGLAIRRVDATRLPRDWRQYPAPDALAAIGSDWARGLATAALSVPSAVVPRERNVLLNPAHPDFRKIRVGRPEPFSLDARLARDNTLRVQGRPDGS